MSRSRTALLLIDFINDFAFDGGADLADAALPAALNAAALRRRARRAGAPVVFVNDNFGHWRAQLVDVVKRCARKSSRGHRVVDALRPQKQDYYVLKRQHSGFYLSPLELLLAELDIDRVVLTGLLADSCVLFTANDAYLRRYRIIVAADCLVARKAEHAHEALSYMARNLKADIVPAAAVRFG